MVIVAMGSRTGLWIRKITDYFLNEEASQRASEGEKK